MKFPRYAKYRDTGTEWLSEIPEHWSVARLRWLASRYAGGTPDKSKPEYWTNGTVPWLASGTVNQVVITEPSEFITEEGFANSSTRWIPPGALVMALAGQGKTKGMVAQLAIRATCNQSMAAIIPGSEIDARFLFWWLTSNYQNIRNMAGGDLRDGLNLELLGNIPCPLPGLREQRLIAGMLDRETRLIDRLVAEQTRLIELLAEKRQATISLAVTRGLNSHAPLRDADLEWLDVMPAHWRTVAIKHLAGSHARSFTDGDWIESPFITDQGIRLIQTGNIGIGAYKEQGYRYVSEDTFLQLGCTEVGPGDILICRLDGPVGRACIAPDLGVRMITSVDNTILKVDAGVVADFVVALLSSVPWLAWTDALCRVGGGFRLRISRSMLGEIRVPLPPTDEQTEIVAHLHEVLSSYDTLTSEAERAITLLRERRTALISAAVTGSFDLRGVSRADAAAA